MSVEKNYIHTIMKAKINKKVNIKIYLKKNNMKLKNIILTDHQILILTSIFVV